MARTESEDRELALLRELEQSIQLVRGSDPVTAQNLLTSLKVRIGERIVELLEKGLDIPASSDIDKLGRVVRKVYGTDVGGEEYAEVVAICSVPSYTLKDEQGNIYSWRQDLTREVSAEEETAYWRARARAAERHVRPKTEVR